MGHQEEKAAVAEVLPLPKHVLIFPLPMQGHVKSMLKLAELFCISGLHLTVLLSDYTHGRLLPHANVKSRFGCYQGFHFATISNGLPNDHPRVGERSIDIMMSLNVVGESQFRNLMVSTDLLSRSVGSEGVGLKRRPVTCLIMDGVLSFAARVSEKKWTFQLFILELLGLVLSGLIFQFNKLWMLVKSLSKIRIILVP